MRIQRRDFKRAQTKSYTKRRNCIPNFIFVKDMCFRKDVTKKECKGEKKGNTTLIEYATWFFTKLCAKTHKYEKSAQQKGK